MELTTRDKEILDAAIQVMDNQPPQKIMRYFGTRSKTFRTICASMRLIGQRTIKKKYHL